MSDNHNEDYGKQISDTVKDALGSGDLSRLKNIGPVIQDAVQKSMGTVNDKMQGKPGQPGQPSPHGAPPPAGGSSGGHPADTSQQARPAWMGGAAHTGAPQSRPVWQRRQPMLKNKPARYYGVLPIALGAVGLGIFTIATLVMGVLSLMFGAMMSAVTVVLLVLAVVCAGVMVLGIGQRGLARRLQKYYALFANKTVLTFPEIVEAVGIPEDQVHKDIKRAMAKQLLPDVHVDTQETCLIYGEEAYRQCLETEKARQLREREEAERELRLGDPVTAELEKFKIEGAQTLKKIRAANNAIPGEEISGKLSRLEEITGKIFSYVENHPEKLPDTRRFMNYYLPTTLKLVERYQHYEEMDVQLENVNQTKAEIATALDTIDNAFKNLLASLYHEDTLDIATDISVLNSVLEQEGLTGRKFDIEGEGTH